MPKKGVKKTVKEEGVQPEVAAPAEERKSPVQVVEVIDDINNGVDPEALATIRKDAQEIEQKAEELENESAIPLAEQKERTSEREEERVQEETPSPVEERKEQGVIDELFQKDQRVGYPEISEHKAGMSKAMLVWAAIVIGVALLVGGTLFLVLGNTNSMAKLSIVSTTPTPAPTSSPAATPTPGKKEDLTIEVLNGGGTPGAASKMKKLLESKGYKVSKTGNADAYTYDKTEILVKASKSGFLDGLKSDLKDSYTVDKAEATLPDNASTSAQVIVGKE